MATVLRRTGTISYSAMLAVKNKPTNWSTATLLLHFVEQPQASTVFVTTDPARAQIEKCEPFRFYDLVPGKCVRNCPGEHKYGVQVKYEVTLKFATAKLQLSKEA